MMIVRAKHVVLLAALSVAFGGSQNVIAAEKSECIRAKQQGEVVRVNDLSQTLQIPTVTADGKTVLSSQTLQVSSFKVTVVDSHGTESAFILPAAPKDKFIDVDVEVCASLSLDEETAKHVQSTLRASGTSDGPYGVL